jgi:hypothetical protein
MSSFFPSSELLPVPQISNEVLDFVQQCFEAMRDPAYGDVGGFPALMGKGFGTLMRQVADQKDPDSKIDEDMVAAAILDGRDFYSSCIEKYPDFQLVIERISQPGRGFQCAARFAGHVRASTPRDLKPESLAQFVRNLLESCAIC